MKGLALCHCLWLTALLQQGVQESWAWVMSPPNIPSAVATRRPLGFVPSPLRSEQSPFQPQRRPPRRRSGPPLGISRMSDHGMVEFEPFEPTTTTSTNLRSETSPSVPASDHELTASEVEFAAMVEHFLKFDTYTRESVRDPLVEVLLDGVVASSQEPAVFRAFQILFEDLYPLRVAARIVYKQLNKTIQQYLEKRRVDLEMITQAATQQQQKQEQQQQQITDHDDDIEALANEAWTLTKTTALHLNHRMFLTPDQIETACESLPLGDAVVLRCRKKARRNKVRVAEFLSIVFGVYYRDTCADDRPFDDVVVFVSHILTRMEKHDRDTPLTAGDRQRERHGRRYDEMLASFRVWKTQIPQDPGRRMEVVRGCFVGAENDAVVQALRICFVDYTGLRVAAELIFKMVSSYMK